MKVYLSVFYCVIPVQNVQNSYVCGKNVSTQCYRDLTNIKDITRDVNTIQAIINMIY